MISTSKTSSLVPAKILQRFVAIMMTIQHGFINNFNFVSLQSAFCDQPKECSNELFSNFDGRCNNLVNGKIYNFYPQ